MKYFLGLLLFCGCCSSKMMDAESYCNVMMGMNEKEVVEVAGSPYSTCKKSDGSIEYEYIERFDGFNRKIMQINYFITIRNGKVVNKRSVKSYPPGYVYDALDYQSMDSSAKKEDKNPTR